MSELKKTQNDQLIETKRSALTYTFLLELSQLR